MDECERTQPGHRAIFPDKTAAIGHITAESMDTSKPSFLPSVLTKQSLEDLNVVCGPFESSLLPVVHKIAPARELLKAQGYDNLVCTSTLAVGC